MKKIIIVLVLLAGIKGKLYAQHSTNSDKTFNIPANSTDRKFYFDLGKGNKLQIEVKNIADLDKFHNMDSLIYGLLQDLKLLKDSLADESTTKRIDYIIDDADKRKIRLQQFKPVGSSFVVNDADISSIKMEQDTVNFIGKINYEDKLTKRNKVPGVRYYKATFILNSLADIGNYMNGIINQKIDVLQKNVNKKWDSNGKNQVYHLDADPTIKANANKGYIAGGDFLELRASVALQNYKSYFDPSFGLGATIILGSKNFKREIGLTWENHFSFAKNIDGKLQSFRSQFLTLSLAHGFIADRDPRKESFDLFNMTFSRIISRKGDMFDKNTMRLGLGALSLYNGKTRIQPVMYFTDFFKGVTPGIRLVQSF